MGFAQLAETYTPVAKETPRSVRSMPRTWLAMEAARIGARHLGDSLQAVLLSGGLSGGAVTDIRTQKTRVVYQDVELRMILTPGAAARPRPAIRGALHRIHQDLLQSLRTGDVNCALRISAESAQAD